ncbi:MAG TPA: alpha/beta fold hydrolase [Nostocaceae cyanobacterium]|nr:alpha/beta fold hydrolase [Nostocaceae cyanobacterium]
MQLSNIGTQFYTWQNYRCSYEVYQPVNSVSGGIPLLLIHPIGVGLSRRFWRRFCQAWEQKNYHNLIYSVDLLGCGNTDKSRRIYKPIDWAQQLQHFLQTVVQKPVILMVQGSVLPVALELVHQEQNLIAGLVLSDPTSWPIITKKVPKLQQNILWSIFDSPVGNLFFRYARTRKFLSSFSCERLFADSANVDDEWLNTLIADAQDMGGRYAVFSFLARFWQQDYSQAIASVTQPTLLVMGESAASISKEGKKETPDQRLAQYLQYLPRGQGVKMTGKNIMPYENAVEFVDAIAPFIQELSSQINT